MSLRFDGKVALVTGAGGGLGEAYAILLASRGAKVVVNDIGKTKEGAWLADLVVDKIKKAGNVAAADHNSVVDGAKVVKTAIDNFGRIDILINNAGIIRDVGFARMTDEQFDIIVKVHLYGAYACTKAAWPHMRENKYGRIVMITSINGVVGQRGQANYSSAKAGLIGFGKALALEGAKENIKVNIVAPAAGTQMTATILPENVVKAWKPEYVAPMVAYLCHETVPVSGKLYEASAGWFAEIRWQRSKGAFLDIDKGYCVEDIRDNMKKISDFTESVDPAEAQAKGVNPALEKIMAKL